MGEFFKRREIQEKQGKEIIGYEIVFFNEELNSGQGEFEKIALANEELLFYEETLLFIPCTSKLFFSEQQMLMFPAEKVIFELEQDVILEWDLEQQIKKYYEKNYKFSIRNFQFIPQYFRILSYIEYVGFDVEGIGEIPKQQKESMNNAFRIAKRLQKKCVIWGIHSKQAYDGLADLKVDLISGKYCSKVEIDTIIKQQYLSNDLHSFMVAISRNRVDIKELEEKIGKNAFLTYNILQIVNAPTFFERKKVKSISEAVMIIGIDQLRKWFPFLLFYSQEKKECELLIKKAFFRGFFAMELMKDKKGFSLTSAECYMMGVLSIIELIVDTEWKQIIDSLEISCELKYALTNEEEKSHKLYVFLLAYEEENWHLVQQLAKELMIEEESVKRGYIHALYETNKVWKMLTSEYQKNDKLKEHIEDLFY